MTRGSTSMHPPYAPTSSPPPVSTFSRRIPQTGHRLSGSSLPTSPHSGIVHRYHGSDWLGLHKRDAYHVKGVRLFPLFTGFLALALLLGLLAAAWYREGR